jgi:hypothetical protein
MAASYPASLKTFTTKGAGDAILSAHINDIQAEVVAVETQLGTNAGTLINYTPAWTASSTNPVLGDGTLTGKYTKIGRLVWAWVYLLIGSTTTMGTGTYYFSLPVTASEMTNYLMGTWAAYKTGTGHSSGVARYASSTTAGLALDGAVYLTSAAPWTPENGDKFFIALCYSV